MTVTYWHSISSSGTFKPRKLLQTLSPYVLFFSFYMSIRLAKYLTQYFLSLQSWSKYFYIFLIASHHLLEKTLINCFYLHLHI